MSYPDDMDSNRDLGALELPSIVDQQLRALDAAQIPRSEFERRITELKAKHPDWAKAIDRWRSYYSFQRSTDAQQPPPDGPPHIDGYEVADEVIGRGGTSVVYRGRKTSTGMQVAVKVLSGLMQERVIEEARTMAKLRHPNVCRLVDVGQTAHHCPFLITEYVDGTWITHHCAKHKLDWRQRLILIRDACLGMAHAHALELAHCDLKPSNIMVETKHDVPGVIIIDFGLAKSTMSESLATHPEGTRGYMAPELFQKDSHVAPAPLDVYSMGVVLGELLAPQWKSYRRGKPSDSVAELPVPAATLASHRMTSQRAWVRTLRGPLDSILLRATDPDPRRRHPTIRELADDIEKRLQRPIHPKRTLVAAAAALIAVIVWVLWPNEPAPLLVANHLTFYGPNPGNTSIPELFQIRTLFPFTVTDRHPENRVRVFLVRNRALLLSPRSLDHDRGHWQSMSLCSFDVDFHEGAESLVSGWSPNEDLVAEFKFRWQANDGRSGAETCYVLCFGGSEAQRTVRRPEVKTRRGFEAWCSAQHLEIPD